MGKKFQIAWFFTLISIPAFANFCDGDSLFSLERAGNSMRGLVSQGFSTSRASAILQHQPEFLAHLASLENTDPHVADMNFREVVLVYRGLRLDSLSEFSENRGLFAGDGTQGAIDVSPDYKVAKNAALTGGKRQGFIITYQVPRKLLISGRFDEAFRIPTWHLISLGISDVGVFRVLVENVK